jgi:hypothetical protein
MNVSRQIIYFVTQMRLIILPINMTNLTDLLSQLNAVAFDDLYGQRGALIKCQMFTSIVN